MSDEGGVSGAGAGQGCLPHAGRCPKKTCRLAPPSPPSLPSPIAARRGDGVRKSGSSWGRRRRSTRGRATNLRASLLLSAFQPEIPPLLLLLFQAHPPLSLPPPPRPPTAPFGTQP
eukprot:3642588-Rhodomonas_salina.2